MSLYQVIQILKSNCETIKTVQLIYNDKVKKTKIIILLVFWMSLKYGIPLGQIFKLNFRQFTRYNCKGILFG
jgi:hypothetical protein